mmetsp:Transcript_11353/g.41543  ORF Transcript_11353/g.41543 Transcript_11353/m.41543 type:complete len:211 (+) Transcript_11353:372-1004(+)
MSSPQGMDKGPSDRKKIFVGGLASTADEDALHQFFSKFGPIQEILVMREPGTNRPRGFGFVTFDDEEAVNKVLVSRYHEMGDKRVEVKAAVPRGEMPARGPRGHSGHHGGPYGGNGYVRGPHMGGYGGPYGGYGGGYGRGGFAPGPYGGGMPYGGYGGPEGGYPGAAMPPMAPPPSSGGWSAHVAPDGTPYYYNERTGVSQWERPPELQG